MEKISGIVLRIVKFNDKHQVIDLFTLSRGRMAFVAPVKVRLSPLMVVDIMAEIHPNRSLQKITSLSSVSSHESMQSLRLDPLKSMIMMYMAEFLSGAIREEAPDTPLYKYIEESLKWLDLAKEGFANFHLVFMMKMTRFLGFAPNLDGWKRGCYFDLASGCCTEAHPTHQWFLQPHEARALPYLLRMNYENMHRYALSHDQRFRILGVLNDYYSIHIAGFSQQKSLEVLHEMFE